MPADTTALQKKWDQHFAEQPAASADQACEVLRDNAHLLPSSGLALDLACGLGANALFLARAGLSVHAWDISDTALTTLSMAARQQGLDVMSQRFDIEHGDWPDQRFDVICVSRFLNRALCPRLLQQLRPGGLLFYQTFSAEKPAGVGPSNPDFVLQPGELLSLFSALQVRYYRENGRAGQVTSGNRSDALFVGQKPHDARR